MLCTCRRSKVGKELSNLSDNYIENNSIARLWKWKFQSGFYLVMDWSCSRFGCFNLQASMHGRIVSILWWSCIRAKVKIKFPISKPKVLFQNPIWNPHFKAFQTYHSAVVEVAYSYLCKWEIINKCYCGHVEVNGWRHVSDLVHKLNQPSTKQGPNSGVFPWNDKLIP